MTFVLATRGSELALWQARAVAERLAAAGSGPVELLEVHASADLDQRTPLERFGRTALFTAEVDRAVLDGSAHAGVHSLKDATTTLEPGLELAAVLPRGPVEDALVTRDSRALADLPRGARVATGSLRRGAMLLAERPDLELLPLRGNVARRLARLDDAGVDAVVVARAALERLGLGATPHVVLDPAVFVPAVCQGIVGVVCRADDGASRARLTAISDARTFVAARAERSLLRALRGGCNVPAGALAHVGGERLSLAAKVLSPDGRRSVGGVREGAAADAEVLGRELALTLLEGGAAALLAEARSS